MTTPHQNHPKILARLKRAHGHLAKVVEMLESEEPCLQVAQQMHAVEKAIVNAKRALIHDHIDHCLVDQDTAGDLEQLKSISKYL
ncbi:MAG: metal-sensing transcriptional repressor [Paracoccaceae bacterium]